VHVLKTQIKELNSITVHLEFLLRYTPWRWMFLQSTC